jgi:uncharacterized RDD family membrane protein YckC
VSSIIGTVISDRYRIVRLLGEGADKQVYLAEDVRLYDSPRAVAVMVDTIADRERQKAVAVAFDREAEMLTKLRHPRIPQVFDRFSEGNVHYLVMEFVEGETLQARLNRVPGNRLPEAEAVRIATKILAVLDYLHRQTPPVIFRDLKPDNVILCPDGELKLIDFGIARFFRPTGSNIGRGTVGYAAPEQYRGVIDARSDIYALGAALHHMLTGRDPAQHPFDFPPVLQLVPNCDPNLAACIDSALEREPAKRPQSAAEFRDRILPNKTSRPSGASSGQGSPAPSGANGPPAASAQADRANAPTTLIAEMIVEIPCDHCHAPVAPEARFCTRCGHPNELANPTVAAVAPRRAPPARQVLGAASVQGPIHSSPGITEQPGYAGFWRRAVAALVDGQLLNVGSVLLLLALGVPYPRVSIAADGSPVFAGSWLALILVGAPAAWLYFTILESSALQSTPGKLIFGARVTDLAGRRITFARANARYWGKLLDVPTLAVGYLMAAWTRRKQALHDKLAETLVILGPAPIGPVLRTLAVVAVLFCGGLTNAALVDRKSSFQPGASRESGGLSAANLDGKWLCDSHVSAAITGDIIKTANKIKFENSQSISIKPVGVITRRVSNPLFDSGEGTLYALTPSSNPVLLNGNQLCGPEELASFIVIMPDKGSSDRITLEVYAGASRPQLDDANSQQCGSFAYVRADANPGAPEGASAYSARRDMEDAAQGDPEAQFRLGAMYEQGVGVPRDYIQALRWLRRSAAQGDALGQFGLGGMYEFGEGVPRDYDQALRCYRKSAAQGNSWAQFYLGDIYENGRGVPQDYNQALIWYRKSAAQGDDDARTAEDRLMFRTGR